MQSRRLPTQGIGDPASGSLWCTVARVDGSRADERLSRRGQQELNTAMDDRAEFLNWFDTTWRTAEVALHDGDAGPRFATWSDHEPVTLFGAWMNASGVGEVRTVFRRLAGVFSGATSSNVDVVAAEVSGDLAYTAHREITSTVVGGVPRDYVLRVTQIYRREDGDWKVVHRHGDAEPDPAAGP